MIDLNPNHFETVKRVLAGHVPDCEVRAFGSRATWTAKDYSDLDLAVVGENPVVRGTLARLKEAFEESDLPMRVDVVDWHDISESFRGVIERDYVVVQKAAMQTSDGEWEEVTLGELGEVDRGRSRHRPRNAPKLYGGPYPFIQTGDIKASGGRVTTHTQTYSEFGLAQSRLWPANTMVITIAANIAETAVLTYPACFPDSVVGFVADESNCDVRFIEYTFRLLRNKLQHENVGTGSVQDNINLQTLDRLRFLIPPLSEQRAIAHVLGTLDDKIELNRRMNQTLEAMARALFKSWFVDFDPVRAKMDGRWLRGESLPGLPADLYDLFPDRLVDSELGKVPEGWEVRALGVLIELAYGKALKADDRKSGSIPVHGSNGQIGWHNEKLVAGPGIVVGRKGNPGVVTWAYSDFFPIDTAFHVVSRNGHHCLPFLYFALSLQDLPSISADSAVPGLNRNLAYMNQQIIPPNTIMGEFSDCVSALFARRHLLEGESRSLADHRDTLLPKLVSGQLPVVAK